MADPQMSVLYLKDARHVVGAIMQRSGGTPAVADLVKDAFELHDAASGQALAHIAPDDLKLATIPISPANRPMLVAPSTYGLTDQNAPAALSPYVLTQGLVIGPVWITGGVLGPPGIQPGIVINVPVLPQPTLTATTMSIMQFPLGQAEMNVFVNLEGAKGFHATYTGKFAKASGTYILDDLKWTVHLVPDDYVMVVCIQGYAPFVANVTLP
jgi:hypothetical protein